MPGDESYELYIDGFTPASIPMARLAHYMASLAELLGYKDRVHFGELRAGSLGVTARIEPVARPKVDRRVDEIRLHGKVPESAKKALKEIDDALAEDNTTGSLRRGNARLIEFPGRDRYVESKLGPVIQAGSLDGEVIMIGGRDATINLHLKAGEQVYHCVTSRAVARRLASHLFGNVRVLGTGTWARLESGVWHLKRFEISDFEALVETPLSELFGGLRQRLAPPEGGRPSPAELMHQLRED